MFTPFGPELDAELAYRRESLKNPHHEPRTAGHWIRAMVLAAGLHR